MLNAHTPTELIEHSLRLLNLRGRRGPLRDAIVAAGGWSDWQSAHRRSGAGVPPGFAPALATPAPAALLTAVRAWLSGGERRFLLPFGSVAYPPDLSQAPSPPMLLFGEGDTSLLRAPGIAVVGSRTPTPTGIEVAAEFARGIAGAGLCVVSGLAAGIDAAAHHAALPLPGKTVAVLGCGPDIAFPTGNARLMQQIAEEGLLLTEHAPGTQPQRSHFPSRNRIVAGLALATVVVEARLRSGALISARLAAEAGREVFAVPGSVRNLAAEGCHQLIRDGAVLATRAEEVIESLAPELRARLPGLDAAARPTAAPLAAVWAPPENWSANHKRLWSFLGEDPTPMDELIRLSGLTYPEIGPILLGMELDGRVEQHFGRFRRTLPG